MRPGLLFTGSAALSLVMFVAVLITMKQLETFTLDFGPDWSVDLWELSQAGGRRCSRMLLDGGFRFATSRSDVPPGTAMVNCSLTLKDDVRFSALGASVIRRHGPIVFQDGRIYGLQGWVVSVPLWPLAAVFAVLPALWAWRKGRPRQPGVCSTCGYDLRASPGCCPECGRAVESERDRGANSEPSGGGQDRGWRVPSPWPWAGILAGGLPVAVSLVVYLWRSIGLLLCRDQTVNEGAFEGSLFGLAGYVGVLTAMVGTTLATVWLWLWCRRGK